MSKVNSISELTYSCENTSNYALQLALKTMQERCQQLQKRLATVEDENCSLRMKYCKEKDSIQFDVKKSEVDILKDKIALLAKQKSQLAQNVMMVAAENRSLWSRLSKLTDVNNSLGNQLLKINDTLNQHKMNESQINPIPTSTPIPTHLIRSKTFTQHSPRERIEKNELTTWKVGETEYASLEEISLKIMDRLLKEKADLEDQCAQMIEIQNEVDFDVNTIGFTYPEAMDDDFSLGELTKHSEKLYSLKDTLISQQEKLRSCLEHLKKFYTEDGKLCEDCIKRKNDKVIIPVKTPDSENQADEKTISTSAILNDRRLCPMCGEVFNLSVLSISEFHSHVESHFIEEDDCIVDNYEIITTLGT